MLPGRPAITSAVMQIEQVAITQPLMPTVREKGYFYLEPERTGKMSSGPGGIGLKPVRRQSGREF